MVGHSPLERSILVQVQVPQHERSECRAWTRTGKGSGKREFSRSGGSECTHERWNRKVPKRNEAISEIPSPAAVKNGVLTPKSLK